MAYDSTHSEDDGHGVISTDGDCLKALKRGGGLGLVTLVADALDAGDLILYGLRVDALELAGSAASRS